MECKVSSLIALLSLCSVGATAEARLCTNQDLIDNVVGLAGESSSPLLGKIQLLDAPFNIRTNPYFHTAPDIAHILADHDAQCVADVVTNRSLMMTYYGWQTINGKTYIGVKLVPKMDDEDVVSAPADDAAESVGAASASWQDVLPKTRRNCANQWKENYEMQAYYVEAQRKGWEKVTKDRLPVQRSRPEQEYAHDDTVSRLGATPSAPLVAPTAPPSEQEAARNYVVSPMYPTSPPQQRWSRPRHCQHKLIPTDETHASHMKAGSTAFPKVIIAMASSFGLPTAGQGSAGLSLFIASLRIRMCCRAEASRPAGSAVRTSLSSKPVGTAYKGGAVHRCPNIPYGIVMRRRARSHSRPATS